MADLAVESGWVGIVVNGAIRETQLVAKIDAGVKTLGTNPRKSGKSGSGERNIPVSFGR